MSKITPIGNRELPVADLIPRPEDLARHSVEDIEQTVVSVRSEGLLNAIKVVDICNEILGGHKRLLALKRLG